MTNKTLTHASTTTSKKPIPMPIPVTNFPENDFSHQPVLSGPNKFSHSNILRMQQTVGNQAVMRMLSDRSNSIQRSVAPANVIQRKGGDVSAKELAPSRTGGLVNSSWSKIHTAYKDYMAATDPEKELHYLRKLQELVDAWKKKREDDGKYPRGGLISRLEAMINKEFPETMAKAIGLPPALIAEVDPADLTTLAIAAQHLGNGDVGQADPLLAELKDKIPGFALIKSMLLRRYMGEINPDMAEAMNNPKYSYAPAINSDPEKSEVNASNDYAAETGGAGYVGYQRRNWNDTEVSYKNRLLGNFSKYEQPKAGALTDKQKEKREFERTNKIFKRENFLKLENDEIKSLISYSAGSYDFINTFLRDSLLPENKGAQDNGNGGAGNLKDSSNNKGYLMGNSSEEDSMGGNANEGENSNDRFAEFSSSESEENSEASNSGGGNAYLDDYDKNIELGKAKKEKGKIPYTKTAISALNKLKPYKGKVYRHSKLFSGYKELNRPGAVVTDMGFTSSTYNAGSLLARFGTDIMEIITSKSGKFIKPISLVPEEDEVLFKPGTRFKVTKRFDAQLTADPAERIWPADLDAEAKAAKAADPSGPLLKIIVIKEEV